MAEGGALQGLRVLIAEDNLFAAMELEKVLVDLGCEPIGPVAQLDQALRLARQERLDGALLDVDLRGELVFAVAEELERRRIPVIFASGYDTNEMFPDRFARHPRLRKPFGENEIQRVLEAAIGGPRPDGPRAVEHQADLGGPRAVEHRAESGGPHAVEHRA